MPIDITDPPGGIPGGAGGSGGGSPGAPGGGFPGLPGIAGGFGFGSSFNPFFAQSPYGYAPQRRYPWMQGQGQQPPWAMAQPYGAGAQRVENPYGAGQSAAPGYGGQAPPSGYNYNPINTPPGWYPNPAEYNLGGYQQLHNFMNAGYYDPRGNQQLIEAGRMNAGNISGGLQRQIQLAAQARGIDPTQRATFELQGMLGGQGQYANLVNQALMEAWRQQAQYAQQLGMGAFQAGQYHPQEQPTQSMWGPILGGLGAFGGALLR